MELPGHGQLQNTRFNVGSFMCAAAGSGDRDRLEWVIALPNGTDQLEFRNGSGRTPLLIAASKGHKECVALLLENGADLNATVKLHGEKATALKLAEWGGHTETMNYIRKCQDEIKKYGNCLAKLKREMITLCGKPKSTLEEMERLGKLTKVFDQKADELFDEPLIIRACKAGNLELIEHMVDNLHMTHYSNDMEGSNMLHIAVQNTSNMRFSITKRFPELLSTIDTHGRIPLHIACVNNDMDYIKWLFGLALKEMKPVPPTPPSTPMKYTGITSPPLSHNFAVIEEEAEDCSTNDNAVKTEEKPRITASLSSSEVKLLMENLEEAIPSVPLVPVTYRQHLKAMKLYSVDVEGENIFHVLVKRNHHHLLDYILKTYPQFGSTPTQRDFWIRSETNCSPIDEAITRGHTECLDILIEAILHYLDSTKLYTNDTLLPTAVISNHPGIVEVLIKHGIHQGLGKSLCVANSRPSLPLLLFYSRVVHAIKDGVQLLKNNAAVLDWRDYLLPRVEPIWFKLASDGIEIAQDVFINFPDLTAEAIIKQVGPRVLDHYSQHINEPIGSLDMQCVTTMQLSENEIESVPEELFSLSSLVELDLSSNQIQRLPPGPANHKCYPCKSLKTLTIRHNLLSSLPSWLFLLPSLAMVDACYNMIRELPTAVWISSSLHTLNLSRNRLSRLHDLSNVKDSPQALKPRLDTLFSQLEYRDSVNAVISDVDSDDNTGSSTHGDDLTILCHLKNLDLSYNRFTCVPKDLVCLAPKLEKLFLNSNHIVEMDLVKDLPTAITTLNMQLCGLRDASTKRDSSQSCGDILHLITGGEVNAGYCDHCNHDYLANLGSLNLKDNKISLLQVAAVHNNTTHALFPVLSVLDVSNNQLVRVPDHLQLLTELSSINLSDNLITVMPFSISQLSQLWVINIDNLHLSNVPNAIIDSHSATELKNYLKNLHQKSQPYRRMKLMFVGESNKGKTSLLMALTKKGKVNHYQDIRLNVNRKPLSTVGVDLGDWEYAKQTNILQAGKKVTFMTWDFGGQEEYYATHQCFLSPHALYVVVWSVADGTAGLENLRSWLENIESRAMGAPVIVVGTHADLWDDQPLHRSTLEEAFNKKFLELYIDCDTRQRRTYPKIMEKLFLVDTYNKEHINRLRDAVYDFALEYQVAGRTSKKNSIPLLDELVPACYVSLEESVRAIAVELRRKKHIPILTHEEYINRISTLYGCNKMSTTELRHATQFLHDKGILLHYDEGDLSDLYFVDPQWLCSMLAKVIAIPEVHSYHKNGFIGRNELSRILGPREHVDTCISLMQKFEVLFELDNNRYIIPSLLPVHEDQSCVIFPRSLKTTVAQPATKMTSLPAIPMGSHSNCLARFFMLPFIPNGMFPRLLARLIATDVIEQVLSSLKVDSLVDDQQLINRPHWRVWRTGIMLVWRHIQIFRIVPMKLPLPGVHVVHVIQPKELVQSTADNRNVYEGDSIMVQVDTLPDNAFKDGIHGLQMATWLLHQAVEQINSVFENWYEEFAWKRNVDIAVVAADPCPHCMKAVYEHLTPDLYAAQKRLVDEPKALQQTKVKEKKKRSLTMARSRHTTKVRTPIDSLNVIDSTTSKSSASSMASWSAGRLYGRDERVLYLFSVKVSAVSVRELTVLTCPLHGAITIDQIAPDMIFADLSLNMRVSPEHIMQRDYLDEGGFGAIYAATVRLQDGETQEVVIKTYTVSEGASSNCSQGEIAWHHYQNANSEGRIMASLRHPNILKLIGIALQPIRLLLEYAPLGSLKNVVNRYQDSDSRMNRYALQKVIIQVSSAMEYIHHKKIIYRDLKLANVLVFEFPDPRLPLEGGRECKVLVKLADYGISKQVVPWGIRGMLGTPFYLPPEVVLHGGKQAYTNKIDVYSFGIMLSYLFTYNKPFGKIIRPLRAYLEAGLRPDMSPKHRPSCEWMYELMCWSWSSKPHHRPSFIAIRQVALSQPFTRLHHATRVDLTKHLVSAIAIRYYRTTSTAAINEASISQSYRSISASQILADGPVKKLSLQLSGSSLQTVDNAEVYYGTDYGMVGVVDMQQSATVCQSVADMKSPVTCMLIVNDYLWVGTHGGVKVYNATNKQLVAVWVDKAIILTMILVPSGHCSDGEAIVMLTKSRTLLIFPALWKDKNRLLLELQPEHEIEMNCEVLCALLVPTSNQLWVCISNKRLAVFNPGCYDNPKKYDMPDMSQPCCLATVNDFVLIAAEARIQKWNPGVTPVPIDTLDCEAMVMENSTILYNEECYIVSMLGINNVLYAGTRGGAIVAVNVDKMIMHGVMHVHTSPINTLALLKQQTEAKVATLKRKQDSLILNHSLHHDPQDNYLLVNFALGYHGVAQNCESRPTTYNIPSMTSQCRYQQPSPTHNPDDLYMLLWSAHPW